jgi:hypothetical protein
VGRVIANIQVEEPDGTRGPPGEFNTLAADATLVYELDPPGTDPNLVLSSPTLSGLLAASGLDGALLSP